MQARAVDSRQRALADESARFTAMLQGGFIAPNEVEQTNAQSSAAQSQLLEANARVYAASLEVRDCVLKAPFAGEVSLRTVDPGAFVRPGMPIVSLVDRNTVRVTVDAPEKDFDSLAPGTKVDVVMLATGADVPATVSRRAPNADAQTRTVHFEVDVPDPDRHYPTATTALVRVDVGKSVPAIAVPLYAATQHERNAKLFVVVDGVAHARGVAVLGERGGTLYLDPKSLPERSQVVTEGRALLSDGDPVRAVIEQAPPTTHGDGGAPVRGGGFGRPL
jgi:RND family efflux transporter MFP subunit